MPSSIVTASKTRGRTPRKPQRPELALHSLATPAFGKADLSNCEREQIHLAGSIQPHGALLLLREPDLAIVQASENAASFFDLDRDIIGCRLDALPTDLAERLRPHLPDPLSDVARAVRCN